jgi:hypothetical protein
MKASIVDHHVRKSAQAAKQRGRPQRRALLVGIVMAMTAGVATAVPQAAVAAPPTTFRQAIKAIPGLTHYYPLDAANQARDVVGTVHGVNHGATFGANGATFNGYSYIELPDNNAFSAATTGAMTVVVFNTITNWKGAGASEYVHWMGKGVGGAHEWTFRHYVAGGSGEAASRQYRTSFYHFNPAGGLGAGSYFQDPDGATERMVTGMVDRSNTQMWKNGVLRDTDALSGYSITPRNTTTPVRIGTRDMATGYMIGRLRRVAFYNRKLSAAELQTLYAARALPEGAACTATSSPPAAAAVPRYITSVYADLFNRVPDPGGLATWTTALKCGTPRVAVANAITYSSEYRSKLIAGSYVRYLRRSPDPGGLRTWLGAMSRGWTISQMESGFIASPEYYAKAGSTHAGWVRKLYADVLRRSATPTEVAGWTAHLRAGTGRSQVAMGFLLSSERLNTVVDGHYRHLLGRGIDPVGQRTWVGILKAGGRDEAIIGGIIASSEYYGRI